MRTRQPDEAQVGDARAARLAAADRRAEVDGDAWLAPAHRLALVISGPLRLTIPPAILGRAACPPQAGAPTAGPVTADGFDPGPPQPYNSRSERTLARQVSGTVSARREPTAAPAGRGAPGPTRVRPRPRPRARRARSRRFGRDPLAALEAGSRAIRDPVEKLRFLRRSLERYEALDERLQARARRAAALARLSPDGRRGGAPALLARTRGAPSTRRAAAARPCRGARGGP